MKYLAAFSFLLLVGGGCSVSGTVNGEDIQIGDPVVEEVDNSKVISEVKAEWDSIIASALAKDCPLFNQHLDEDIQQTDAQCEAAFNAFEKGVPEIDWEATQVFDDKEVAIFMLDGTTMTTYMQLPNKEWVSLTTFWPGV